MVLLAEPLLVLAPSPGQPAFSHHAVPSPACLCTCHITMSQCCAICELPCLIMLYKCCRSQTCDKITGWLSCLLNHPETSTPCVLHLAIGNFWYHGCMCVLLQDSQPHPAASVIVLGEQSSSLAHKLLNLSPGECSTAVAALIALISPLPYSADFRPYFTIHDPDYQAMTLPEQAPSNSNLPRLLGVTNRYFLKVCSCTCLP